MFESIQPTWVHVGLPCGTCSRARDKPLAKSLVLAGAPQPRPLRDELFLFGLPDLTPAEQHRVTMANAVYENAEVIIFQCFICDSFISLENPERSWLWAILAFLVKKRNNAKYTDWYFKLVHTNFDACCHGALHPKATRLKASPHLFEPLEGRCPGNHEHAPWGVRKTHNGWAFDTANLAQYERLLCSRMLDCVTARIPQSLLDTTWRTLRLESLQQAGQQHRQQPQLIPEFFEILFLDTPPDEANCKVLRAPWETGEDSKGEDDHVNSNKYKVGIYFSPTEHLERALTLEHPASFFHVVPNVLRQNIFELFTMGISFMAKKRVQAVKDILQRKKDLEEDENQLKNRLDLHVREVTSGKTLVLFRELLQQTGFEDMSVCDMMEKGLT